MNRFLSTAAFLAMASVSAFGQGRESSFTANITGGGGDGKCTIEVDVDDAAIVEINGDRGRLITTAGQPAQWRRFQCNQRMPARPNGFRFKGIDGRGRQTLLKDPNSNRGIAAIRIEDPNGGREGYTFDIEWRGGSDYNSGGGRGDYRNDRNSDRNYDRNYDRNNDRRDDPRDRGGFANDGRGRNDTTRVTCSSDDGRRHYCDANTRQEVRMVRQISGSECRQGSTWGYDRRGIWVDRGCRAEFEVRR